eukprot:GHVQ01019317.1.p1 GENE.GHVQ01019317.1~~GHVQ01019317.1.p1  ORF type:complete len:1037 (-),score=164.97 GHVQ01019317.1:174-3284(-)
MPATPSLPTTTIASVNSPAMHVVNRHGEKEAISFDRILQRVGRLCGELHPLVDPARVCQAVIRGMYSGIKTTELDELSAETCAYMATTHPDYAMLAARLTVDNLRKETMDDFGEVVRELYEMEDGHGIRCGVICEEIYKFVMENRERLNSEIRYDRDFDYDYFGFKTLERSYLFRIGNKVVERPQHMLMRVSCGIHCGDIERAVSTYHLMSTRLFTHATPTLFNAGTPVPQLSSCFLLDMQSDSIEGIFSTLKQCALISKTAGGIGVALHRIRATNSYIRSTNGRSNGLIPMLRVFNDTARYVDQGGGKRKGSCAVYLEPWHADVLEFLDLRKNHGKEDLRCRDLFLGLWVPDLLMRRVEKDERWTLMCPDECPGLFDVWGEQFEQLYVQYECQGKGRTEIRARDLWYKICESQVETGTPYMVYKDSCNRKSNQKNLGTLKSSNLCAEVLQYTSPDEVAVCNLASLALPKYVQISPPSADSPLNGGAEEGETGISAGKRGKGAWMLPEHRRLRNVFDHRKLYDVTKEVAYNLNCVIDRTYYPVESARRSNLRHRPIGIGVQGLADCFMLLGLPFESEEARTLNAEIFETLYYAACEASCRLAEIHGPYETFKCSPASEGRLQFDLWEEEAISLGRLSSVRLSGRWDWHGLKLRIIKYGMRNSLLIAAMPTASTSQILGNTESFEPYTSNVYTRRVLSGEFYVVNSHLLGDLICLGLWNDELRQKLVAHSGSVQNLPGVPDDMKALYKTVWEIKQKTLIDMAADRGPFIDQSQSLNIHLQAPSYSTVSAVHFHGWRKGLKTGMYYLRTRPAADAIKFSLDPSLFPDQHRAPSLSTSSPPTVQTHIHYTNPHTRLLPLSVPNVASHLPPLSRQSLPTALPPSCPLTVSTNLSTLTPGPSTSAASPLLTPLLPHHQMSPRGEDEEAQGPTHPHGSAAQLRLVVGRGAEEAVGPVGGGGRRGAEVCVGGGEQGGQALWGYAGEHTGENGGDFETGERATAFGALLSVRRSFMGHEGRKREVVGGCSKRTAEEDGCEMCCG